MHDPYVRSLETAATHAALALAGGVAAPASPPILDAVLRRLASRHPRAFGALTALRDASVLIDPIDCSRAITLRLGPEMRLRIVDRDDGAEHEATIRGPLAALMDLLEGRIDGDALFFRRELRIEGDTALVLALRNAFDGEEMDVVADLAAALGPVRHVVPLGRRAACDMGRALDLTRLFLLRPVLARLDALERRLDRREG